LTGAGERRWLVALAAAAVVVVAGILAITGVFGGGDAEGPEVESADFGATTAVEPPPTPPQPAVRKLRVGGRPDAIAAGGDYVWVADSLSGKVSRLNPASKKPIPVDTAGFPTDVAADAGGAWLALADRGAIQRLTADTGAEPPIEVDGFPFQIASGEGAVWAMSQSDVQRVDAETGAVGTVTPLEGDGAAIAAGEGGVWVTRANKEVVRLDPADGAISGATAVPGAFNLAVGESAVWALGAQGTLARIDPASGEAAGRPVKVPQALDVAAGLGFVWIAAGDGTVTRFEPDSGVQVGEPIRVGRIAQSLGIGGDSVWVAAPEEGTVVRITP
jgi:DNA-binding beta-propeller fold protein YncE